MKIPSVTILPVLLAASLGSLGVVTSASASEALVSTDALTGLAQTGAPSQSSDLSQPPNSRALDPLLSGETPQLFPIGPAGLPATGELDLNSESPSTQLELAPVGDSRIAADGRSTIMVQGRVTDSVGELLPTDVVVTLTSSAGRFVGPDQDPDQPGFQVIARQGQFSAELQSDLQAQKVRVRASVEPAVEAFTQVEFVTDLRPPVVTGSVSLRIGRTGSDFYRSFRDFLNPGRINDGIQADVDAAVFATGRIGEWLLTAAFNSDRPLNQTCDGSNRLFRDVQFCEQNYPVYGDSSTSDYLTPSIDQVFVRLQRTSPVPGAEADYAMWGDYNTEEFARASQLFSATTRQLHGFKANYSLGNLQATLLYANNIEGFQRDTIVPDGTSGYYFLSQRPVIGGSENVFLESEELYRPGTVIQRKALTRGVDYDIDYDRGTLLFRQPILATEIDLFGNTLVRRVVTTYEFDGDGNTTNIYGARLQYHFSRALERASWAGVSYLREDQGSRDFELYAADARIDLGDNAEVIAEISRSINALDATGSVSGNAYRLEINSTITPNLYGRAYFRAVDESFSNNATLSFVPGQTRYGAALSAVVGPTTNLQFRYDYESNYGISSLVQTDLFDLFAPGQQAEPGSRVDNSLRVISAGVQQRLGPATLSVNWVNRQRRNDLDDDFSEGDSNQLVSRLTLPLAERLTFRAQNELNLSSGDSLYPDRTTVGLDWRVFPGVSVRLAHQFGSPSITSLDTVMEHSFSNDTKITGRYSILGGANGMTTQGAVGLNHRWRIAPGLRLNLTYERIFGDVFARSATGDTFAQPYAVGQSASSLLLRSGDSYSVGLEYNNNSFFQASARFERRSSSGDNNTVITAGAAGKLSPALTALLRYEQANSSNQLITGLGDSRTLRVGMAYRNPENDQFNALVRYEYRQNPDSTPDNELLDANTNGATDHTFALEAIYAPNWRWEFYGKYALRSTSSQPFDDDFTSGDTISIAQLRATYQLNYQFDLAGEVRWIHGALSSYDEVGWVAELGYYLSPDLRLAVGYSFGSASDREFNNDRSDSGPYVALTVKLNELFRGFGLQRPSPRRLQEPRREAPPPPASVSAPTDAIPTQTAAEVSTPPAPGDAQ